MKGSEIEEGLTVPRWAVWLGLLAWTGFLILWTALPDPTSLGLLATNLRSWSSLAAWIREAILLAGKNLACFVPVGFLSVSSLRPREGWLDRSLRRWIPAVALSFMLAALVRALHTRPAAVGPLAAAPMLSLLVSWTGCLLGTWAGMAWAQGMLARLLFLPKLALLVALLLALLAGSAWMVFHRAVDTSPASIDMPKVTSADRRHLYDLFAGKNPLKIRQGSTTTLRLTAHELNLLLAWGLSVEGSAHKANVELTEDQGQILASLPFRGGSRFLNVTAHGTVRVHEGKLDLQADRLRLGRWEVPHAVLRALSPVVARAVADDPRLQPILERAQGVELQ